MATTVTGYTGKVIVHHGLAIKERVVRVAYARNGNTHNPTVYKAWDVWDRTRETERLVLRCETLREAKRFCEGNPPESESTDDPRPVCTCRHVVTIAGRPYFGGIDDCPVHGFGPTLETGDQTVPVIKNPNFVDDGSAARAEIVRLETINAVLVAASEAILKAYFPTTQSQLRTQAEMSAMVKDLRDAVAAAKSDEA